MMGTLTSLRRGLVVTTALYLAGCGGGGGSTSVAPPSNPTPPPPPPAATIIDPVMTERGQSAGLNFSHGFDPDYDGMPSLFAGGAAIGDIDGDGDDDLIITHGDTAPNLILINSGGQFSDGGDSVVTPGRKMSGPMLADMDSDGDLDLFMGGLDDDGAALFGNDGSGTFTDVTAGSGLDAMGAVNTISAAFGDYDDDGDLDLALAHWGTPRDPNAPGDTETLWRNDSSGGVIRFTSTSETSGVASILDFNLDGKLGRGFDYSFAPNFIDYDDDGDLDLTLVTDFRGTKVLRNRGDGTFEDDTDTTQITDTNGMGTDFADLNDDGTPDWFVTSINSNRLYMNERGSFIDRGGDSGLANGGWGWGTCFADLNADGRYDAVQTNGWVNDNGSPESEPYTADRLRLWLAQDDGTFEDRAEEAGMEDDNQTRAVICHDFDGDTDIDVLALINGSSQGVRYWENETASTNAITVRLDGPLMGVGAKIETTMGETTRHHWVRAGSTFTAQTPLVQHIGLGDEMRADVRVIWADGTVQDVADVAAGTALTVTKP